MYGKRWLRIGDVVGGVQYALYDYGCAITLAAWFEPVGAYVELESRPYATPRQFAPLRRAMERRYMELVALAEEQAEAEKSFFVAL